MANKHNAEQQELLEDIADSVDKTNTRVSSLEQKVDALINLLQNGKDDKKENQSDLKDINKELVKNAFSEYFNERDQFLSTVQMNLTDNDIKRIVDGTYDGLMDKIVEHNEAEKKRLEAEDKKNQELRKQQGISSSAQIAEWAPEYPEALRNLLFYFAQRIYLPTAKPELVQESTKILGDTLIASYHEQFSWRSMVGYYRKKVEKFCSNWKILTLSICLNAAIIFIVSMSIYHSKVMEVDMRNQIIDHYWKKDYFRNRDIQAIDSIIKHEGNYNAYKWVESR